MTRNGGDDCGKYLCSFWKPKPEYVSEKACRARRLAPHIIVLFRDLQRPWQMVIDKRYFFDFSRFQRTEDALFKTCSDLVSFHMSSALKSEEWVSYASFSMAPKF
uniref:Carbohydrate sulfotransferase n=1 Tax=Steinernema glaseri TaxID=37863 RepID=A0A1I8ACJ0_9BILA